MSRNLCILFGLLILAGCSAERALKIDLDRAKALMNRKDYPAAIDLLEHLRVKHRADREVALYLAEAHLGEARFELISIYFKALSPQVIRLNIPVKFIYECNPNRIVRLDREDPACLVLRIAQNLPDVEGAHFRRARVIFAESFGDPRSNERAVNLLIGITDLLLVLHDLNEIILELHDPLRIPRTPEELSRFEERLVRLSDGAGQSFFYLQNSYPIFQGGTSDPNTSLKLGVGDGVYSAGQQEDLEALNEVLSRHEGLAWVRGLELVKEWASVLFVSRLGRQFVEEWYGEMLRDPVYGAFKEHLFGEWSRGAVGPEYVYRILGQRLLDSFKRRLDWRFDDDELNVRVESLYQRTRAYLEIAFPAHRGGS